MLNKCCSDIILYISSTLFINNLRCFILQDKSMYSHRYAIIKNNKDFIKYMIYDTTTPYYYIIFDNTYANIYANCYDYLFNDKELYAATNIISYYVISNVIRKEDAVIYLFNIFIRTKNNNYRGDENVVNCKIKNRRVKLCRILFGIIYNYNWEYLNINLYDLFNIIYCIVYKRYNNLYDILYNIRIHKSLEPLRTLHILISYENEISENANKVKYSMVGICKYTLLYIIYIYIENIQNYIINEKYTLLMHVIVDKCIEIKEIISDNSYLPDNLKLLVLSKINCVYNIFSGIT